MKGLVSFVLWQLFKMADMSQPMEMVCQRVDLNLTGTFGKHW